MLSTYPVLSLHLLGSLHEFHDVSIRVLDHGDADPRANLLFRKSKLYPFAQELGAEFREVLNDKGDITEAQLALQSHGTLWRDGVGFNQFEIAGTEAQPVHGPEPYRGLPYKLQPQEVLIKVEAGLDIADQNTEIQRIFGRLHHHLLVLLSDRCGNEAQAFAPDS